MTFITSLCPRTWQECGLCGAALRSDAARICEKL